MTVEKRGISVIVVTQASICHWLGVPNRHTQNYVWIWRAVIWMLSWLAQACTTWDLHEMVQTTFMESLPKWSAARSRPFGHWGPPKFKILPAKFKCRFVCGRGTRNAKKTSQWFSRVPWECPQWELQNEPPLDMSGLTSKIPLWPASGSGLESGWP